MRSTRTAATAAALLTLTLLAGCGGGDGNNKSSDKVTETVTPTTSDTTTTEASSPTETTSETTSETPMDPNGADITQDQVNAALLTPEDLGAGFVAGTYTHTEDPPLCDPTGEPLDQMIPPQVQGGTELDLSDGSAALQEEIAIYSNDGEAAQVFGLGAQGLQCTHGTSHGTPVKIGKPQDVTSSVDTSGHGTTTAWQVTSDSFKGVLLVTVAHRVVLATSYAAAPDADTSSLPNPIDVQAKAFAKALAN